MPDNGKVNDPRAEYRKHAAEKQRLADKMGDGKPIDYDKVTRPKEKAR